MAQARLFSGLRRSDFSPPIRRMNTDTTSPLLTIESAAARLSLSPEALRARCRRSVIDDPAQARGSLGPGIVALKLGRSWRIAISSLPAAPATSTDTPASVDLVDPGSGMPAPRPTRRPRRVRDTPSPVRYSARRRRWVVDFYYTDGTGLRRRCRRDATSRTATGAQMEAERLMLLARTTGQVPDGGAPTFGEFVKEYFEKVYVPTRCRPSTTARYREMMRQGVLEFFGAKRVDMILAHDFRQYAARLQARGIGLKAHLSLARTVLRAAVEAGHLARLPDLPRLPRVGKKLPMAPTAAAVQILLENSSGWMHVAIALAAYAGLRGGEVRALEVQDVDFERDVILVRRAFSATEVLPPKSGDERVVPLAHRLRDVIAPWLEGNDLRHRVVVRADGATPRRQPLLTTFYAVQAPLIEKGLLDRRWSFHQLRHFFCSELVRCGASVEAVRLLAGHADLKTTQRYVHARAEELRETMRKLDHP